ncbi:LOW QUALITY PROTEIN: cyclic AMP-responsive element-binding protein 3 [Podargus strigoides]
MSCPEELDALADKDLLDFLLKDDAPCPETPGEENDLLEDCVLPELELLDEEMDSFISSLLNPSEDEPDTLQDDSLADSDSSIFGDQHLSHSPGSDLAGSPDSSGIVQVDHNYSLHQDWPALESVRPETSEGDAHIDLETCMGLEGASETLEQSSSFPTAVAVDAEPQLVLGAIVQSDFPELVLTEEGRHLLEKEGFSLPTSLPLTKESCWLHQQARFCLTTPAVVQEGQKTKAHGPSTEMYAAFVTAGLPMPWGFCKPLQTEDLLNKVHRKICNKQAAQDSHHRKMYVNSLENRVAVCTAQNHELQKVQLLQRQNSLLKQLWKLRLVRQSTTKTTMAKTCTMLVVLSFCLILSPSICLFGSREPQPELRVLSRQIREFPSQVAPDVWEEGVLEGPEDLLLLGSLTQSWEEGQSLPSRDPRSSFNSNSSSDPAAAAGSKQVPPQPQEQHSPRDTLQAAVPAAWRDKRQEWVERATRVVIQPHCTDEM